MNKEEALARYKELHIKYDDDTITVPELNEYFNVRKILLSYYLVKDANIQSNLPGE